jgi:hypothetical protein
MENTFEVNGVRYARIKKEEPSPKKKTDAKLASWMVAAQAIYAPHVLDSMIDSELKKADVLPEGTNIIEEYGLIQLKKSRLSKRQRDQVVHTFERNYVKVDTEN